MTARIVEKYIDDYEIKNGNIDIEIINRSKKEDNDINEIENEQTDININNLISNPDFPYKAKYLLTKTEYGFFKQLQIICDAKNLLICPKVRLEDFIQVTDKQNFMKYRGYIKSRHIDFIICDKNLHILFGLELDDKTQNSNKSKKTDNFKNELFKTIQITLERVNAESIYKDEITSILKKYMK